MKTLELKSQIPAWARDLRVNLGNVLQSEHLTEQQLWGTALAVARSAKMARFLVTGPPTRDEQGRRQARGIRGARARPRSP